MLRRSCWTLCSLLAAILPALAIAQPKKDLILWGLGIDADAKGREAVVREFQLRHPEYNVRALSFGAGNMNPQKLLTSIVGDVAPDVINQDRFTISDWASRGAFTDLDPYIARDLGKDPLCPRRTDYYPSTWDECTYEGHLYALPAAADNRALYWNKAIFRMKARELRASGLDPARPPRTWSELLAYSKVLTEWDSQGALTRVGFMPNFGNSWLYLYGFQNNARFISEDGRTCTANSPEVEESLRFIVDGYDLIGGYALTRQFESGFLQNENDAFLLGDVAMKIDGNWILNSISRYAPKLEFGVAPAPVPDQRFQHIGRFAHERDTYVTWTGGFSYAMPRGARNPEGAWTFLKFAASTEGRLIEAGAQNAWERRRGRLFIPNQQANIEANEQIFRLYKPADPKFADALRVHKELMLVGRNRPVTMVGQILWNENQRALENASLHLLSPHEALLRDQQTVQTELDNFNAHRGLPVFDFAWAWAVVLPLCLATAMLLWRQYCRLRLGSLARHEARWGYFLVSPWLVGFLVFTLGPMIASLIFSFTEYNALTDARWVGARNYLEIFTTDRINTFKALSNAFYLAGVGVPLGICTGLSVALLLNSKVRGQRWYRTIFYLPAIVPTIPSAILWAWVLNGDPNKGLVNSIWQHTITAVLNLSPPGWLQSESWSKPALVIMGLWGAGSGMILWLAALKGIPQSHFEASAIDGASSLTQFFSISLPQLSPIIFFNLVVGCIGAIQEFDRIYVMRPSDETVGPADSLLTPVFHLFSNAFGYFKIGYASALAWGLLLIIVLLTAIQFKLAPRWVHYEAGE